jgi:ribulose-5-phosphate 4-epimerase/fuculose-1-phosphate aldolase
MTNEGFRSEAFKTFYLSKEIIINPLIIEFVKFCKKIKEKNLVNEYSEAILSFSYGKRIIINGDIKDYSNVAKDEIIEVADYDPIKNNLLVIGKTNPKKETSLHWMIHHARNDVNCIFQLNNKKIIRGMDEKYPENEKEYPIGSLEQIKETMKNLHNSKIVVIKNKGILIVGNNIRELEEQLEKIF